ncbi:hypothetical protein ACFPRL_08060 [Pseudoclavibacter helvolus]
MELHAGNHCNARRACAPAPQAAREAPCRDLRINGPRRRRSWSNRGDDAHGCRRDRLGRRIALAERAGDLAGTGAGLRGTRRFGREFPGRRHRRPRLERQHRRRADRPRLAQEDHRGDGQVPVRLGRRPDVLPRQALDEGIRLELSGRERRVRGVRHPAVLAR